MSIGSRARSWPPFVVALLAGLAGLCPAPASAADVAGKWTWTVSLQGTEIQRQAEFKQAGEKLTGAVSGTLLAAPAEIREGTVKGDAISFSVSGERDGVQFQVRYQGKVSGDAIKGTITLTLQGQDQSVPWEAKRARAVDLTGKWSGSVTADEKERPLKFEFKQAGGKLTGSLVLDDSQPTEIRDGAVSGEEVTFSITHDHNGQPVKVLFKGRLDGATLKGKASATVDGTQREASWTVTRS